MQEFAVVSVTSRPNEAPGWKIWQLYAGQEYVVFIDESFHKFFNFEYDDGNFAHGAVGIPASRYRGFADIMASAVKDFQAAFKNFKGAEPRELKSADLYKLEFGARRRLLLKLCAALAAHGGVIAGFYTSNRGYVMEKIRESLISQEGIKAVPDDHAKLYESELEKLNDRTAAGPGMSNLISKLLLLPVASLAYFFSALGCPFRVVYDPRQEDEDAATKESIDGIMTAVMSVEKLRIKSKFLGLEIGRQSHEEFGLQIADLVAGEVRHFFRFNPDLLTFGSNLELITFDFQDGEEAIFDEVDGKLLKKGRQIPIPGDLIKKVLRSNEDCALPYFRKLLASGLVTCITEFGTERDVALFEGYFLDLCD